jgi:hypothetical protein
VIEQELDALARGEFPLGVLRGDALLAAAKMGALAAGVQAGEDILHQRVRCLKVASGIA